MNRGTAVVHNFVTVHHDNFTRVTPMGSISKNRDGIVVCSPFNKQVRKFRRDQVINQDSMEKSWVASYLQIAWF